MSQKLVGGFMSGCIADVYDNVPEFFAGMNILFTVLDSGIDTFYVPDGQANGDVFANVNGRLFVRADAVAEFVEHVPFIEFSEVYLIPVFDPPPTYEILEKFTAEACNFNELIPRSFLSMFSKTGASRFLADGCGLNYYCAPVFAQAIENMYVD
jgi:hypothetical protein